MYISYCCYDIENNILLLLVTFDCVMKYFKKNLDGKNSVETNKISKLFFANYVFYFWNSKQMEAQLIE